jgi:hypothetical protein
VISGTDTASGISSVRVTAIDTAGASTTTSFRRTAILGRGAFGGPGSFCVYNDSSRTTDGNPLQPYPCISNNDAQLFTANVDGRFEVQGKCVTAGSQGAIALGAGRVHAVPAVLSVGPGGRAGSDRSGRAASVSGPSQHGLGPVGHIKLGVDVVEMVFHGLFGDQQAAADGGVGVPRAEQVEYVTLAAG